MSSSTREAQPAVTVVIPAHGVEAFIEACIDSVTRQTLREIEVLVVDDHSPDGLAARVLALAEADARIQLIRLSETVGQGFARNHACERARGRYVFFLDGDDLLASPRTLERLVAIADSERADMVRGRKHHGHDPVDANASYPRDPNERHFTALAASGDIRALPELWLNRHFWVFLYRREFLERAELRFENPQWEERPFLVAAFLAARRIVVSDVSAVLYRIRDDSTARRDRGLRDLELIVRNAQLVCEQLRAAGAAELAFARQLTMRQYLGFLVAGSRWHALLDDESPPVAALLEAFLRALASLDVGAQELRSDLMAHGPITETDGDCALFWHLWTSGEYALARQLGRSSTLPPEVTYAWLLDATSPHGDAINAWLRTRTYPAAGARTVDARARRRPLRSGLRLVLHVGMSKTGSTHLQNMFDQGRPQLLRAGVWYPPCGYVRQARRPHKCAGQALFNDYAVKDDPTLRGDLLDELERLDGNVHTVIVSSEAFFLSGRPAELARYFAGFDTQIVVYLRRQDHWAQSQYMEAVAGGAVGRTSLPILDWLASARRDQLDYEATLAQWRAAFSDAELLVRVYEPEQLAGGSLASDFAAATGLGIVAQLPEPPAQQRNLAKPTRETLSAMRVFNALPFPNPATYLSFACEALHLLATQPAASEPSPELLGPDIRRALIERADESNRAVRRRYIDGQDGPLFRDADVPSEPALSLTSDLSTATIERLLDLYRRSLPIASPRRPKPPQRGKAPSPRVVREDGQVRYGERVLPASLDALHDLRPREFLRAVELFAELPALAGDAFEAVARPLREGRLTKTDAAARLLRRRPSALRNTGFPLGDQMRLLAAMLRARS